MSIKSVVVNTRAVSLWLESVTTTNYRALKILVNQSVNQSEFNMTKIAIAISKSTVA